MKDILLLIEKRAEHINSTPFARESLRFCALLDILAKITREMSLMGGGGGIEDLLIDLAANAVAWVEFRRPPGSRLEVGRKRLADMKTFEGNA